MIVLDNRGFMTANGEPDNARAARYVLKDFLNGKLLHCCAPPSIPQKEFHTHEEISETNEDRIPSRTLKIIKVRVRCVFNFFNES